MDYRSWNLQLSINAYIASSNRPWIIDSRSSSHMTSTRDKFDSLIFSDKYPPIHC